MGKEKIEAGLFSDGRSVARAAARRVLFLPGDAPLVVVDAGLHNGWPIDVAAVSTPGWRWVVLSPVTAQGVGVTVSPIVTYSWSDDSEVWRTAADVVVTTQDAPTIIDPAHATIMITDTVRPTGLHSPDPRTFANLSVHVGWPTADLWPTVLANALMGDRDHGLDTILDHIPVRRRDPRP